MYGCESFCHNGHTVKIVRDRFIRCEAPKQIQAAQLSSLGKETNKGLKTSE